MIWSAQRSPKLQMDFANVLLLCQILKINFLSLELRSEVLGQVSTQLREPRMPSGDTEHLRLLIPFHPVQQRRRTVYI